MSARDEPMYLATARVAVRSKERISHIIARELIARIDRDAAALKAAQPRTITTAKELDALPVESVVRSARGTIFEKANFHGDPEFPFWLTPGVNHEYAGIAIILPATVLHEPEAKQ